MASNGSVQAPGVYVVGELIGYRDQRPREWNGEMLRGCDVGLRIAGTVETVSYGARKYAEAAVGGATPGELIALAVEVKSGVKQGRPWQFFAGAREGGSPDEFAAQFSV